MIPFRRGARQRFDLVGNVAFASGLSGLPQRLPQVGFLNYVALNVTGSMSGAGGNVLNADGPWNLIRRARVTLNTGITVVGKRAVIPRGVRIGRNVKIAGDVRTTDFATRVVKTGATVEAGGGRARHRHFGATADAPNGASKVSTAQAAPGGGSERRDIESIAGRRGRRTSD